MKSNLIKGSIFGIAKQIVVFVLLFSVIPIFIQRLGPEKFGIFSLIIVIGEIQKFTHFGFRTTLTKYVSEQGKSHETNNDIRFAIIILSVVSFLILFGGLFFQKFILIHLMGLPKHNYLDSIFLYQTVLISVVFVIIGSQFNAILDGMQRVYLSNLLDTIQAILKWSFILIVLFIQKSLDYIGFAYLFSIIITFFIKYYYVQNIYGKLNIFDKIENFNYTFKKQLSFSSIIYSRSIINFFNEPFSKVLVSHYIGLTAVAYYDIALRISNQTSSVLRIIFYPLFPYIASNNNMKSVRNLIIELEKKMYLLLIPIIVLSILLLDEFMEFWLESEATEELIFATKIILSFSLIAVLPTPMFYFLDAKGQPFKNLLITFCSVIFSIVTFFLTVNLLGFKSFVISRSIGYLTATLLLLLFQSLIIAKFSFNRVSIKFIIYSLFLTILGALLTFLPFDNNVLKGSIQAFSIIMFSIFLLRKLKLFTSPDIIKFFGGNSIFSKILLIIFK